MKIKTINEALDEADVLIFESPVYVYHVTMGPMKHFGSLWVSMDAAQTRINQCFISRQSVFQQLQVQE